MVDSEALNAAFSALAHPTRRAILARLAQGEATVKDIAKPFDSSLPAISQHIRVLEEAGLIARGRQAQFRPCRLNPKALEAVANWTDQYRHIWDARFDAMTKIITDMKDLEDE